MKTMYDSSDCSKKFAEISQLMNIGTLHQGERGRIDPDVKTLLLDAQNLDFLASFPARNLKKTFTIINIDPNCTDF